MIIWSGLGVIVGLIGLFGFLAVNLLTDMITGDKFYYGSHLGPKLIGAFAAGLFSFVSVKLLDRWNTGRVVIDKAIGRQFTIRRRDSLFYIPTKYLPYLIFALGVFIAFHADK